MKHVILILAFAHLSGAVLPAQFKLGNHTTFAFATVEEAVEVLSSSDDYVQRMSPFDRSARMKTDRDVSEQEYLKFAGSNALAWDDDGKQKIMSALQGIDAELESLSLPFPKKVLIIQTTGNEEGDASYTRANAVIIPKNWLERPPAQTRRTVAHELFHILSRANPGLREKLYAAIGFEKCDEVAFPSELKARKITNPDAPRNDHCIRLDVGGRKNWAIPILFSSSEKYDPRRGGEFFTYLQFQFLLVERVDDSSLVRPILDDQKPALLDVRQVSDFFEQVGQNSGEIFHPEEILADNFALLLLRASDMPSPSIVKKMEGILKENRVAIPGSPAEGNNQSR